jgi:hypothetical protein
MLRQDPVSRILHTQQSMKAFLCAQHRPHPGAPAAQLQIVRPESEAPVSAHKHVQAHHRSFRRQVRDAQTWVPCAMCAIPHCSLSLHYLHLPSMTKPWIPLCAGCASGRKM